MNASATVDLPALANHIKAWGVALGFQQVGIRKVALEVTAENKAATRLYERCGFRRIKTLYKPVEVVWA